MKEDTLMSEYMIMTDSTVDLPKEYLTEELGVPYIPLTYLIDGQSYEDMIGLTGEEFLQKSGQGRCRQLLRSIRSRQERHWSHI